jgi:hypothetical protein
VTHFAVYRDQVMALGVVPSDPDSATMAFADLKAELDKEKAARIAGQVKIDMLTWAVKDLKISANRFTTQIPTLEDKVKHLKTQGGRWAGRLSAPRTRIIRNRTLS